MFHTSQPFSSSSYTEKKIFFFLVRTDYALYKRLYVLTLADRDNKTSFLVVWFKLWIYVQKVCVQCTHLNKFFDLNLEWAILTFSICFFFLLLRCKPALKGLERSKKNNSTTTYQDCRHTYTWMNTFEWSCTHALPTWCLIALIDKSTMIGVSLSKNQIR